MTTEVIEGTAVEVEERALTVVKQQPGQALVAERNDPADMVQVASRLATVLKDIVDRQHLYAEIKGKKYPTVEAWMTIARLDNVVAREARTPVRNDDGSYEAFAELVRLSDGMVIGGASALCGAPDDEPWGGTPPKYGKPALPPRAEHARRSMAQTRATSRAFRQQYSWIMALAGYEPTPADEMPHEEQSKAAPERSPSPPAPADLGQPVAVGPGSVSGQVSAGKAPVDLELRETPEGNAFGFVVTDDAKKRTQVLAIGSLADAIAFFYGVPRAMAGEPVKVTGQMYEVPWSKDGKAMPPSRQLRAETFESPDVTLPAHEAESVAMFPTGRTDEDAQAALEAGA
jgi:hypothetical protein